MVPPLPPEIKLDPEETLHHVFFKAKFLSFCQPDHYEGWMILYEALRGNYFVKLFTEKFLNFLAKWSDFRDLGANVSHKY